MADVTTRVARDEDLQALADIYNYEVINGVATLDLEPRSLDDRAAWMAAHNVDNHPLIVAIREGEVAGYASLSSYREKEAYASCVELSIYVHPNHRRHGVARVLMSDILAQARERDDVHTVVSVITTGNEASKSLHEEFGFTFCGMMAEVAYKFDTWLGIDNWTLSV